MELRLYISDNGACPYLENRQWINGAFPANMYTINYEQLLEHGFRRSGDIYYINRCENCNECVPIRIPVNQFKPSKSQRRVRNKNTDIRAKIVSGTFNSEHYEVYKNYQQWKHDTEDCSIEGYKQFLCSSPINSKIIEFRNSDAKLLGCSYVDILDNGLSSVYFTFMDEAQSLSLGTYSVLQEIELCKEMGLEWLYLGFYVKDSKKMSYKANFKPYELAIKNRWTPIHT